MPYRGRRAGAPRERRRRRDARRRLLLGLAVLVGVIVVSTTWFWLIEGFSMLDALYQTVTTVATVGFQEVQPLDASGKVFVMFVIVAGVGAALFTLTALFEELADTTLDRSGRRWMERRLDKVHDHAVVCGYGRIGTTVAQLLANDQTVVVVDEDTAAVDAAVDAGHLVVHGDATLDATLEEARFDKAKILVAALPDDADNLFVVLTGRSVNNDLYIVSRAQAVHSDAKLRRAGADRVVNPEDIGARRLAAFAQRPNVSEFLDVVMASSPVAYRLEEVTIPQGGAIVGKSIREAQIRDTTGALVLGLRLPDGEFVTNPTPETRLAGDTTIIAIGTDAQLSALEDLTRSDRP